MTSLRVVVADDHVLVRAGIRALLDSIDGVEVVGEAGDGREALALLESARVDVLLVDIAMPRLNGIETTVRAALEFPGTRVIVLSMHAGEEYVVTAFAAGASGYLLKDAAATELEEALAAVAEGRIYLSPAIPADVLEKPPILRDQPLSILTERQQEILQLLAGGRTTKQIADRLGVSVKTIESHRSHIQARLRIHDMPSLVRYALRSGLLI